MQRRGAPGRHPRARLAHAAGPHQCRGCHRCRQHRRSTRRQVLLLLAMKDTRLNTPTHCACSNPNPNSRTSRQSPLPLLSLSLSFTFSCLLLFFSNACSRDALAALGEGVKGTLHGMQTELNLLLSMRDEMELTLSTYKLEREIMDKDLQSVQSDYDAVKGAYTALEHEVAEGRKLAQGRGAVSQVRHVTCHASRAA